MIFQVLLLTEENALSNLVYHEHFETKISVDGITDDCIIKLKPSMEYINAHTVNPRKLNIRSQVNTDVHIFNTNSVEPEIIGAATIEDNINLQKNHIRFKTAKALISEEKNITASYDIELDSASPQAEEIIMCQVNLTPSDVKFQNNRADIRIDAVMNCIYRTDAGEYFSTEKPFSLEKSIDGFEADSFEWIAKTATDSVSAKISANSYGEMKVLELDFNYDIELLGIKNIELEAVCDSYSIEYDCETELSEKNITVFKRYFSSNFSVNSNSPRTEINAENAKNVFAGSVEIKNVHSEYNKEKKKLITEGTAVIHLITENNIQDENDPAFGTASYEYPFKCEADTSDELSSSMLSAECTASNIRFRADSQNLYSDFELSVKILALDSINQKYISAVSLKKDSPVSHIMSPMTLCYPSGKETLWDIAKYYKITSDSIIASNGMQNTDISEKKVLLIPKYASKKPTFTNAL